jgi:hypothetical protein
MREFVSSFRVVISNWLAFVLALAGAGLVFYGVYLFCQPAAFIVGGVLLLAAAWDASS